MLCALSVLNTSFRVDVFSLGLATRLTPFRLLVNKYHLSSKNNFYLALNLVFYSPLFFRCCHFESVDISHSTAITAQLSFIPARSSTSTQSARCFRVFYTFTHGKLYKSHTTVECRYMHRFLYRRERKKQSRRADNRILVACRDEKRMK